MANIRLDSMFPLDLVTAGADARDLESLGFQGLWTTETPHDPFLPLLAAALATDQLMLGTGVATAFTRSPMVTALTAWDLQRVSNGRLMLGLGAQVQAHNARRYSTPVTRPIGQLRELINALRHIWGTFQGEHPLDFHGDFYDLDLFLPMHSPGPIEHPTIPIFVAAVGPQMFRLAGEVSDGVHVHSFHTEQYLAEVSLPALEAGLERAGRTREEIQLVCSLFAVIGDDPAMDRAVRSQIAFYGSTTSYRPIFELHGWGTLTDRLKPLARAGDIDAMIEAVPDDVVREFAIVAPTWEDAVTIVGSRYGGILDRVGFYGLQSMVDRSQAPAIASAFAARAQRAD
jgi:probable F420-dependent oxidoreductase